MATTPSLLPEVLAVAAPVVERIVWCTVATAGTDGQPRARLMHPVWSWSDDDVPTALVSARAGREGPSAVLTRGFTPPERSEARSLSASRWHRSATVITYWSRTNSLGCSAIAARAVSAARARPSGVVSLAAAMMRSMRKPRNG